MTSSPEPPAPSAPGPGHLPPDRQAYRALKQAWKPPKLVRRVGLWIAFAGGVAAVAWETGRAFALWLGGGP